LQGADRPRRNPERFFTPARYSIGAEATQDEAKESIIRAQRHLDLGEFDRAREWVERGYEADPTDPKVKQLYEHVLLADAIRQARKARDLRRDALREGGRRGPGPDAAHHGVDRAFRRALEAFDKVLALNPTNVKAIVMKGATLHRMDRHGSRDTVVELYNSALAANPDSEELKYAIRMVDLRCGQCSNSGFCRTCGGRGQVSAVLFKSTCPSCRGSGVCTKCGII
jgi:tetratricopeptide (TPR) repeat protein